RACPGPGCPADGPCAAPGRRARRQARGFAGAGDGGAARPWNGGTDLVNGIPIRHSFDRLGFSCGSCGKILVSRAELRNPQSSDRSPLGPLTRALGVRPVQPVPGPLAPVGALTRLTGGVEWACPESKPGLSCILVALLAGR